MGEHKFNNLMVSVTEQVEKRIRIRGGSEDLDLSKATAAVLTQWAIRDLVGVISILVEDFQEWDCRHAMCDNDKLEILTKIREYIYNLLPGQFHECIENDCDEKPEEGEEEDEEEKERS